MQQQKMLLGNCSCLELWGLGDVDARGRQTGSPDQSSPLALPQICFVTCAGGLASLELCKTKRWPV